MCRTRLQVVYMTTMADMFLPEVEGMKRTVTLLDDISRQGWFSYLAGRNPSSSAAPHQDLIASSPERAAGQNSPTQLRHIAGSNLSHRNVEQFNMMMHRSFRSRAAGVFAAGFGVISLAACTVVAAPAPPPPVAYAPPPVAVYRPAPPPLRVEVIPPPPSGAYVWRPGHWQWIAGAYRWVPGRYVFRQA